jgi:hypothetical protein
MYFNSRLLNEAKELEKLWAETKLLDGISDRGVRATTAVMLENQRLMNEVATDTSDIALFKRISIPLVRRIFPQLIANKIVSVQPLLGPAGLVYYLRFRYASNKGNMRGGVLGGFPTDDATSLQQLMSGDANLNIFFTHQFVQNEVQTNAGGGTTLTYTLEKTPVIAGTVTGTIGTALNGDGQTFNIPQANATGALWALLNITSIGAQPASYVTAGTLDPVAGVLTLTWAGSAVANNYVTMNYEYNLECQQDLPEVNLVVESEEIVAKTRKLKAAWSYEAQQDLRSQHNLDAEAELTAVLAQEINLEIDREVLTDLRLNAGTVAAWDFNTALGDTIKEKYESLYVKIVEISNVVHRKTLRGGANWIVTSPEVASIFETATAGFAPQPSENFTSSIGIQYVGTVAARWRMYKDPLFPTNQILLGYRGDSYMDSGYFYCPYVPLTQTPVVLDPESFCPRKGILTRYGKKLLREGAKFYARMTIANFVV